LINTGLVNKGLTNIDLINIIVVNTNVIKANLISTGLSKVETYPSHDNTFITFPLLYSNTGLNNGD